MIVKWCVLIIQCIMKKNNSICTKCVTGSFINCALDRCFDNSFLKSIVGTIENSLYHHLNFYNKYIDAFIVPSNFLADLLKNKIDNTKIQVIPNFVDIKIPKVKEKKRKEILYFGRIIKEKGLFQLVNAFKEIDYKLTIIGTGPDVSLLEKNIKNIKNVIYLGAKYNDELFSYVQSVNYIIQPAKGYENCPMTVIEAYSLGVPVIVANHSGFKELVKHGETGYLLDFNDIEDLKKQLITILAKPTEHLIKNISLFYQDKLSKEKHLSKILAIYNQLLACTKTE